MTNNEKEMIKEEWDNHVVQNSRECEHASFSPIREARFCEAFRNDILNQVKLTLKEKFDILTYAGLQYW